MIVISEPKLTKEQIDKYHEKGYRVCQTYDDPVINRGEAVGFILDKIYKSTIEKIEYLLFTHHNVSIKYGEDKYLLNSLDDWKQTYQDEKDMQHMAHYKHPILLEYEAKRSEYFEQLKISKVKVKYDDLYEAYNINPDTLPQDEELDSFLKAFAYLYQIDVDYTDRFSKIQAYYQIQWYLDNDVPYANEPHSIAPEDEPMFRNIQFVEIPYEEPIEIESFGDEIYMEDYIYKNSL